MANGLGSCGELGTQKQAQRESQSSHQPVTVFLRRSDSTSTRIHVLCCSLCDLDWDVRRTVYTVCAQRGVVQASQTLNNQRACKLVGWLGCVGVMSVSSWPASGRAFTRPRPSEKDQSQDWGADGTCLARRMFVPVPRAFSHGHGLCQLPTKQSAPIFTCHWCLLCISLVHISGLLSQNQNHKEPA